MATPAQGGLAGSAGPLRLHSPLRRHCIPQHVSRRRAACGLPYFRASARIQLAKNHAASIIRLTGQFQIASVELLHVSHFVRTKTPLQADKVLDAAARLFGTQRFHEVRMEDIATEASVGKGTIYRYFADKEELYMALLERSSLQILEHVQNLVSRSETARGKLQAIIRAILDYFDQQPHLLDLIQRAEVMRGPDFPWQETRTLLIRLVANVFQEAKDKGEFVVHDPELAGLLLLNGLRGVVRAGKRPRPNDLPERIVDGFLQGFAQEPAGVRS
jgi:AcrR family transcriptional regulator